MELKGKVKHIGLTEVFGSGFQKRMFVIEAKDGSYTNDYGFELMKDNVSKIDGVSVGDEVEVKFNIGRCREYQGKYFASFPTAWFVKNLSGGGSNNQNKDASDCVDDQSDDDLPF